MQKLKQLLPTLMVASISLGAASIEEAKRLRDGGQLDEAQQALAQMIAGEPQFARMHYELGDILIERLDYAGAEREFARVAELGQHGLSLIGRGRVQLAQERAAEAKELFNLAQAQTPVPQQLLDQIQAADNEATKAQLQMEAEPIAALYYDRGMTNALLRDFTASAADLETSTKLDPANAKAHYYAGLAYNALKRPDMMVSHFQTYLSMEPKGPESARVRSVLRGVR